MTEYLIKATHRKRTQRAKAVPQESPHPLRSLWLNVFSAPAHERALPAPAVHLRLSRGGMSMEGGRMTENRGMPEVGEMFN